MWKGERKHSCRVIIPIDDNFVINSYHSYTKISELVTNCASRCQGAIGTLRKTAEDGDCNVGKTIRLITQDKKRT